MAKDPFDFLQSSKPPQGSSLTGTQWSFQAPSSGTANAWGNATVAPSKTSIKFDQPVDDDDGWGDFEMATPAPDSSISPAIISPTFSQASSGLQHPAAQDPPPRAQIVRTSTFDLFSNNLVDTGRPQSSSPAWPSRETQQSESATKHGATWKPTPKDPNVLFDAEDFELSGGEDDDDDDDEFRAFETVTSTAPPPQPAPAKVSKPPPPSLDLLSLDDPPQSSSQSITPTPTTAKGPPSHLLGGLSFGATSTYPQAPKSPSFQERNPFPDLGIKTFKAPEPSKSENVKSATPITAWPSFDDRLDKNGEQYHDDDDDDDDGDEWAAWDDAPADQKKTTDIDAAKPPESWDWDAVDNVKPPAATVKSDDSPPPINVPPPSIILSIFPDLLGQGSTLFKPISGQSASIKERVLSDPKAGDFLQGYILLATTAARVIAGRKQRWHRDKILAKSMSISAAGSKGMKLAGIDKTQSAREDREAADVVAVWKQQVGRLRSAVAAAKVAGKATLQVPELSETPQVQTAKMVPTAPKPCVICGLKREERVTKVDFDVEDSFGEWWTEHWGHKACKNFWLEHEQRLRTR